MQVTLLSLSLPPPLVKAHQTQAPLCRRGQWQGLLCSQSPVEGSGQTVPGAQVTDICPTLPLATDEWAT